MASIQSVMLLEESYAVFEAIDNKLESVATSVKEAFNIEKIIGLSDQMVQTSARLNLMNDGMQTSKELQDMIFRSAQSSGTAYQTTADRVAGLSSNVRDVFNSTAETVDFAELVSKQFAIAGASTEDTNSAFSKLTQSLSSGVMRGDELNSIFAEAPNMIQTIADYLSVPVDTLNDMAAGGQLTAEVVKNAMISATDDINNKFNSMPMTWEQVGNTIKNQGLMAIQPILEKFSEIANNPSFQEFAAGIVYAISNIASVIGWLLGLAIPVANAICDNWSDIEPIIVGVAGAFAAFKLLILGCKLAQDIGTIAMSAYYGACALGQIAVGNLTVAQSLLNATMLKNPIILIAAIIIGILLVALYQWIKSCASLEVAWLKAENTVLTAWDNLMICGSVLVNHLLTAFGLLKIGIVAIWYGIMNFIEITIGQIAVIIQELLNMFIPGINEIIKVINKLPNVSIDLISEVTLGTDLAAEAEARKQARQTALNKMITDEYNDNIARETDIATQKAEAVRDAAERKVKIEEATKRANEVKENDTSNGLGLSGIQPGIESTAENTATIAKSVSDSTAEIKYLRDVAEREVINRFTTAEIKVNMGGIHNKVNKNTDLDGVVNHLENQLYESLNSTAEQYNS
ncbi:tape measure domain-containing protein [Anaerosporobacter mobilis DSM 15930]|uniref:Tape measure domain-containing protein n=1 Tax=Anaerosporobacter mobilis DSM 15930 TaxID=1120996 RepID=A0A1M7MVQ6_9FIRM|nr:tape measure protein [Anaerosporobacter mobilis]SHM95138.1 tape measure domain-containing protein [Anaerosporobacter mobilis DSM 15930]